MKKTLPKIVRQVKYGDKVNPLIFTRLANDRITVFPPIAYSKGKGPAVWVSNISLEDWNVLVEFLRSETGETERFIYDEETYMAMEKDRKDRKRD